MAVAQASLDRRRIWLTVGALRYQTHKEGEQLGSARPRVPSRNHIQFKIT